ncbi:PASTA domain-containing protein [Gimesia aquarii]|uniref:PASTA domain-containing protein n=1 Tax=Gimesia aquarii TaxID=2527964 RepID=A0A517VXP0_9PLAN|nr:PASTA domain-containing protein [Gimesia aquarii]QDT97765.1 hypothetical protein V144x_32470 [Gimesia aquarii]
MVMNNKWFLHLKSPILFCLILLLVAAPHSNAQLQILVPQKTHPDLEEVLLNWQNKAASYKAIRGSFKRSLFDRVLSIEKRSEGKFYFEKQAVSRFDTYEPIFVQSDKSYNKFETKGLPYKVISSGAKKWINNSQESILVNDKKLTFEIVPIDLIQKKSHDNIMEIPPSFFFEMTVVRAKELFEIKLIENSKNHIILVLKPFDINGRNINSCLIKVVLNHKTYLPKEVQISFPRRLQFVYYTFEEVETQKTNVDRNLWLKGFFDDNCSFYPDLAQYKQKERVRQPIGMKLVPSITGLHASKAEFILKRSGFKTRFVAGPYAEVGEKIFEVCGQDPAAETFAKEGSTVKVFVLSRRKSASNKTKDLHSPSFIR